MATNVATCHADASFPYLRSYARASDGERAGLGASAVPEVQALLERYKELPPPPAGAVEVSHFTVRLVREGKKTPRPLRVLNPKFSRARYCHVHPHETVRALGLAGTVHEKWLKPIALVPCNVPDHLATPIMFAPSDHAGGMPVIAAKALKAGHQYEVKFEDCRTEALAKLDAETRQHIQEQFDAFDSNHDGSISVDEVTAGCKARTAQSKAALDAQYADAVRLVSGDDAAIARATATRDAHYKRLDDSEKRLMEMLLNADTDGDGSLSKLEFALAEAWWLSSTMNPSKLMLF